MRATTNPMHDHLFLDGATVNSRLNRLQWKAFHAGARTLADWHAWQRANVAR